MSLACWAVSNLTTPAFSPHSPALTRALQLAAQAFSAAIVTAASARARLLTLAGLTAIVLRTAITVRFLLKQTFDGSC